MISKVLVAVIMATTIGTSPPPVLASPVNEKMLEAMKDLASPSEATALETVATPSEAEKPDGKASPSEAVKKFVRIEPDEVPEYYSQVSALGKKFWKFKDRNGTIQYRDYGYIQGDTEFPLWYEADSQGKASENSINEDEEYYELAPYLYKSAAPTKASWSDLSLKLLNDSESIFLFDRKESESFKNWDSSTYDIWSVNGLLESEEEIEEEIQNTDLGYFFYGQIANERDSENNWYYANSKGEIWSMSNMLMANLLATDDLKTLNYCSMRVLNNKVQVNDNISKPRASDTEDTTFSLWTPSWSGYTFLGWSNLDNYPYPWYGAGNEKCITSPQNYKFLISGGSFYRAGSTLRRGDINLSNSMLYGMWKPNGTYSLRLVEVPEGEYLDNFLGSAASKTDYIIVKEPGTTIDLTQYGEPTKDGYTFSGWYSGKNGTGTRYESVNLYSDTVLYASFIPKTNIVRFLDVDGNLLKEEQVLSGNSATAPEVTKKEGLLFTGWDKSFSNVTSDLTVTAKWGKSVHLTFKANGGSIDGESEYTEEVLADQSYDNFSQITDRIQKKGYSFTRWAIGSEDGKTFSRFDKITEDTVLCAVWKQKDISVIFYRNYPVGDTSFYNRKTLHYGDKLGELLEPYQVGKGYRLKGWYLNSSGTGESVNEDYIIGDEGLRLYAKWETFDVTYRMHYGVEGTGLPAEIKANSTLNGATLTESKFPDTKLKKLLILGYYNTYYYDKPNDEGDLIHVNWYPKNDVEDVFLNRTPKNFIFDVYNSSRFSQPVRVSPYALYGEIINKENLDKIESYIKPPAGKVFHGFYDAEENGNPIDLTKPLLPLDNTSDSSIRIKLYVIYAKEVSKITFKDWNGEILNEATVRYGEPIVFPQNPVRNGYTFDCWDTDLGTVSSLLDDIEVKAKYKLSSHHLSLDGNGGTISGQTAERKLLNAGDSFDQILTDSKNIAIRKYYTFAGWYTAPSGGSKYPESGNLMPDTDLTVFAQWKRSSSEVIFKDWDGTVLETQEIAIGADATPPEVPDRPGYTFAGWDKPYTDIQDHRNITAQYTINGYKLTLDGNGGTI